MGPHFDFLRANPPVGGKAWGRLFLATVKRPDSLADLAEQVILDPSVAGENEHLVQTWSDFQWSVWNVPVHFEGSDRSCSGYEQFIERLNFDGPDSRAVKLKALLHAERQVQLYDRAIAGAIARMSVVDRKSMHRDSKRLMDDLRRVAVTHAHPPERRAPLPLFSAPSLPERTELASATDHDVDSLRFMGLALAVWSALHAGLAYWRRAAVELGRLLSATAGLSAAPTDLVVLDSSPCGIRRLTAVRVPRAPGSGRTSPVPESSLLAAA
ncbi:hypothetical protein [Streptomyces parvus]|uniref:hypothetical protein n=1 Tax=Streptomyces parvus TaxID=66428 RepID=UPI0035DA4ACF